MIRKRKEVVRSFNYSDPWVVKGENWKAKKGVNVKIRELRGYVKILEEKKWVKKGFGRCFKDLQRCIEINPYFYAQNFESIRVAGLPIERRSSEVEIKYGEWKLGYCSESFAHI